MTYRQEPKVEVQSQFSLMQVAAFMTIVAAGMALLQAVSSTADASIGVMAVSATVIVIALVREAIRLRKFDRANG